MLVVQLTACSQSKIPTSKQHRQAPTNAETVGLLIRNSSDHEVAQFVENYKKATVRELGNGHYEILGASEKQLKRQFLGRVFPNRFIPFKDWRLRDSTRATHDSKFKWPECTPDADEPTASLARSALVSNKTIFRPDGMTFEKGAQISLDASGSQANQLFPSILKTFLFISRPTIVPSEPEVQSLPQLTFTADALGRYRVVLMVQDQRGVCATDEFEFSVTANPPLATDKPFKFTLPDPSRLWQLAAIHAHKSQAIANGRNVRIAVIDTGVNYNHPTLFGRVELGRDFIADDAFPYDDEGHGTHVAGLIAGESIGVAPEARLLAIKAVSSFGSDIGTLAAAIRSAVEARVSVINLSAGLVAFEPHPILSEAIAFAEKRGILVVVAAGNGDDFIHTGFDLDEQPVYPASLPNENILTVGAFDTRNLISPYSNFGRRSVDLVAPGGFFADDELLSAAKENPEGQLWVANQGTSMAAPLVSGVLAQLLELRPDLSAAQIKGAILNAGPELPDLVQKTVSGRKLDSWAALQLAEKLPSQIESVRTR